MGLYYPTQQTQVLIGSKSGTTRTSVTLTAAYDVANKTTIFKTGTMRRVTLDILYTMGATETSNSIEVRVDSGSDGTNFYRAANESASAGTTTVTAREYTFVGTNAAAATISLKLDVADKYTRISVKETGVVTNFGTVFVEATLSGK